MNAARKSVRNIAPIGLMSCAVLLLTAHSCAAADIRVEVTPVRIIFVDYNDDIVTIASNTNQQVTPSVRRNDLSHAAVAYTASIKAQYQHALKRYDFSKPVEVHVKKMGSWERFINFVMHPVFGYR